MPVVAFFEASEHTQEQYDQVVNALDAKGLGAPDGRLFHVAWQSPKGWYVLDVWESTEKLGQFAQVLTPVVAEIDAPSSPPQIYPVHNIIKG